MRGSWERFARFFSRCLSCFCKSLSSALLSITRTSSARLPSVRPVLDLQARYLLVVFRVAGHECCLVRQGDGGDEQVAPVDPAEPLGPQQAVELGRTGGIDGQRVKHFQVPFG